MASAPRSVSAEERRRRFMDLLSASVGGPDQHPCVFFHVPVGLMGPPRDGEGDSSPAAADRIVLVNPLSQEMVVLQTEGGPDLAAAAAMQEILAAEGGTPGGPPASHPSRRCGRWSGRRARPRRRRNARCAWTGDGRWPRTSRRWRWSIKEMPCMHRFHRGCIERWLGMHGSCPVCRYRMPEEKQPDRKEEGEKREEDWRSAVVERQIWVTFGFSRTAAGPQQQQRQQQQQQHATEEVQQQQQ